MYEEVTGWRTAPYFPRGIRGRIEKALGQRIREWHTDNAHKDFGQGVFFSALAKGHKAEAVGVHYDEPTAWISMLVYLTPGAPADAGTSFWRHRRTGLLAKPTWRDAKRLRTPLADILEELEEDSPRKRRWEEVGRIGNLYNRALLFPGGVFHSATRHFGGGLKRGRIYHLFHFGL